MTSHSPDYRSEYLRGRAKELLEYARTMKDLESRRDVETIAKSYGRLADCMARREEIKDEGERQKPGAAKLLVSAGVKAESQADVAGK
jgi:hypothetical protein